MPSTRNSAMRLLRVRPSVGEAEIIIGLFFLTIVVFTSTASAADLTLANDPKGFHGISWGPSLDQIPTLALVAPGERIKGYELKDGPLSVGEAQVDSMRFMSFDGKFARVVIRYRGKETHNRVLAYLQSQFGAPDQAPGSMMRGLNQQYTWRGPESQINLTYEDMKQRGNLFFESRALAPKFLENIGGG